MLLADGGAVHLRPSAATDGPAILAMHERMSDRTRYLRYFQAVSQISPSQLKVFTEVDHVTSVGLVAELGGEIIAAGSYHRDRNEPRDGRGGVRRRGRSAAAWSRFDPAGASGRRRAGAGDQTIHRRGAGREPEHGPGLHRRRLRGQARVLLRHRRSRVRHRADGGFAGRHHRRGSSGPKSRSIARLLSPRAVAVIGASNETRKLGHAVLVNLLRAGFTGPVYPVNPETLSVQGVRAYKSVLDIPDPVDVAVVTVPAASVAEVLESCRIKGVHGLVIVTGGFADADVARRRGRRRRFATPDGRDGQGERHAGARPELPGRGEHRSCGAAERDARAGGAAAGSGRVLLPVRRAGHRDSGRRRLPRAGAVVVRLGGQPGRRLGQRPAAVLARRRAHRGGAAVPGIVRQSAQVRPAGPDAGPRQAGDRGEVRPSCAGQSRAGGQFGGRLGHRGGDPVRAVRGDPHRHPRPRPSTSPNCWPTNRFRAATASRSWAIRPRSECWRSTPAWRPD